TLSAYPFVDAPAAPAPPKEELRRVGFHFEEDGSWRVYARLPGDEGALWEKALGVVRDDLVRERTADNEEITRADAFVALADRALSRKHKGRPRPERYLTLLHVETDPAGVPHGRVHLGPALPSTLRRLLLCDGFVKPIHKVRGVAVSVGRSRRVVPDRTRIAIEDRDRGCRVPGCVNRRWTEVRHILHWEDGGLTNTPNLVLLCGPHHRLHHRGGLGIAGNADDPDGLEFTDANGRRMRTGPRPRPLGRARRRLGHWRHPTGEHLDRKCIWFREPPAA
ncbi:MAG: HNH endonuclease, partial [Actinomycetota bacterium]|nr:HNH endonuclease [Actinomycetota bacterium]